MTQEELHMQMLKTMVAEIERLEDLCSRGRLKNFTDVLVVTQDPFDQIFKTTGHDPRGGN